MKVFGGKTTKPNVAKPNYSTLSICDLHYAPYQRKPRGDLVKSIAENLDWDLFGIISVSYRDGKYWIVDGGHRVAGLMLRDKNIKVLCSVWEGLSYHEECNKFLKLNSQRNSLNAAQRFHARVEEGNKEANNILAIMRKYDFTYASSGKEKGYIINPINAIVSIYNQYGSDVLDDTLRVIKSAWYGDKSSLTQKILRGVSTFIHEYRNIDKSHLIKTLEKSSPQSLEIESVVLAGIKRMRVSSSGGSKFYHICMAIREMYNENVPKEKRVA